MDRQASIKRRITKTRRWTTAVAAVAFTASLSAGAPALAQRVLGLDISAWQGNISTTNWATLKRPTNQQVGGVFGDGRDFVFIRSSRGGTTGFYNQNNPNNDNPAGQNTLSQRYDDPYFVQNITRATSAGLFAGPYHFARPDVIASTLNANGIPNSGTDEADHMIQMSGAFMRPGYLLPTLDLESGQTERTSDALSSFATAFSDEIYAVMGIRPMVYINQNYANYVNPTVPATIPNLWIARWPNQANPSAIDVQNTNPPPSPSTANVYGKWNPNFTVGNPYPNGHPWKFWQYASTGRLNGYASGGSDVDVDVAHGGIEFVKDYLVPALWVNNSDGLWTTIGNWNSGQTPVQPVQGPGQVVRVGNWTPPPTRLPGSDDTVILDRSGASVTITLDSGAQNIRKLYVREGLNITGGSLTVNYVPSADSTPIAAQLSAPVSLSGNSTLSVHTLQVDAAQTFTLGGGTLEFNTVNLMPHNSTPATIAVTGIVNLNPLANAAAVISKGSGAGISGLIDLGGATRVFNVGNGTAATDVTISVPITNGGLTKVGAGTLALTGTNTYAGDTSVLTGVLSIANRFFSDSADIYVLAGATLDLGFSGNPDVVDSLFLNGAPQLAGTWGAVGSGAQFTSSSITGTGILQVSTMVLRLPGDYDQNDVVDTNDYVVWRDSLGSNSTLANDDSLGVAQDDFDRWRDHFGQVFSGGAGGISPSGVPEPSSLVFGVIGFIATWCSSTRRRESS